MLLPPCLPICHSFISLNLSINLVHCLSHFMSVLVWIDQSVLRSLSFRMSSLLLFFFRLAFSPLPCLCLQWNLQRLLLSAIKDVKCTYVLFHGLINPRPQQPICFSHSPLQIQRLNVLSSAADNEAGASRATAILNLLLLFFPSTCPAPECVILCH